MPSKFVENIENIKYCINVIFIFVTPRSKFIGVIYSQM